MSKVVGLSTNFWTVHEFLGLPKTVHKNIYIHIITLSTQYVFLKMLNKWPFEWKSISKVARLSTNFWTVHEFFGLSTKLFTYISSFCPLKAWNIYQKTAQNCPKKISLATKLSKTVQNTHLVNISTQNVKKRKKNKKLSKKYRKF